jgi:hypothetical protein
MNDCPARPHPAHYSPYIIEMPTLHHWIKLSLLYILHRIQMIPKCPLHLPLVLDPHFEHAHQRPSVNFALRRTAPSTHQGRRQCPPRLQTHGRVANWIRPVDEGRCEHDCQSEGRHFVLLLGRGDLAHQGDDKLQEEPLRRRQGGEEGRAQAGVSGRFILWMSNLPLKCSCLPNSRIHGRRDEWYLQLGKEPQEEFGRQQWVFQGNLRPREGGLTRDGQVEQSDQRAEQDGLEVSGGNDTGTLFLTFDVFRNTPSVPVQWATMALPNECSSGGTLPSDSSTTFWILLPQYPFGLSAPGSSEARSLIDLPKVRYDDA